LSYPQRNRSLTLTGVGVAKACDQRDRRNGAPPDAFPTITCEVFRFIASRRPVVPAAGARTMKPFAGMTLTPQRERQVLIVLTLMSFTNILDFMIMMPLSPHLIRDFGISTAQFGLLVSAYAFAAAVSSLLMASIADRFDCKSALLFVYVGLIVGTLGCALAPSYAALLVARTVAGLFGGVQGSIAFSIVGDLIPDERRGRAMGLVMLSFSLSAVIGVPLSIYVAGHGGWHIPFFALAVTCSLLLVVALRLMPSMRGHMRADGQLAFGWGMPSCFGCRTTGGHSPPPHCLRCPA